MIRKFSNDDQFSVKTPTWANNDIIIPHLKDKILNDAWKLNLPLN